MKKEEEKKTCLDSSHQQRHAVLDNQVLRYQTGVHKADPARKTPPEAVLDGDFSDRGSDERHPVLKKVGPVDDADAAAVASADESDEIDCSTIIHFQIVERGRGGVDQDASPSADVVGVGVGEAAGEGET